MKMKHIGSWFVWFRQESHLHPCAQLARKPKGFTWNQLHWVRFSATWFGPHWNRRSKRPPITLFWRHCRSSRRTLKLGWIKWIHLRFQTKLLPSAWTTSIWMNLSRATRMKVVPEDKWINSFDPNFKFQKLGLGWSISWRNMRCMSQPSLSAQLMWKMHCRSRPV